MSKQLVEFKKALDIFVPYSNGLEQQIGMLEGKIENFQKRKQLAEEELQVQLVKNKEVLQFEYEKIRLALARAQKLATQAHELFFQIENSRINIVENSNGNSKTDLKKSIEETQASIKKISEELNIPI